MKKILIANWKAQLPQSFDGDAHRGIKAWLSDMAKPLEVCLNTEVVLAPMALFMGAIQQFTSQLQIHKLQLATQDVSSYQPGAHTGEIPVSWLTKAQINYGIIAHSERREMDQLTDRQITEKIVASFKHAVTPIYCIGETWQEFKAGDTAKVLHRQLEVMQQALNLVPSSLSTQPYILAYEPRWAIGTGKIPTHKEILSATSIIHSFIESNLANFSPPSVLYGGSLKLDNCKDIFAISGIDGGLVGGASLASDDFAGLLRILDQQASA